MKQSMLTIDAPEFSYARFIVIGGKRYRNVAAEHDAPVLAKFIPHPKSTSM
jgi:hypothetical protein